MYIYIYINIYVYIYIYIPYIPQIPYIFQTFSPFAGGPVRAPGACRAAAVGPEVEVTIDGW